MKAIIYHHYGAADVLALEDVAQPVPGDDEVLVRVHAASMNRVDWQYMQGKPYLSRVIYGLRTPNIEGIGADLAGRVEAVGKNVTKFRTGDEVFGEVNGEFADDRQLNLSSCAEFVCVSEDWLAMKPASLSFEEAAAVPLAATTALQGLRDYGHVQPGDEVLINGASGAVGTFAVQIAKAFGAEVTGVCGTETVELIRSIGAEHVIDYKRADFTRLGKRYDLILDNVGNHSVSACRRALKPKGMYLGSFGQPQNEWLGPLAKMLRMRIYSRFVSQEVVFLNQHRKKEDLPELVEMIEAGLVMPVIDRVYTLPEVPEAMRYIGGGHAKAKVVITV